MVRVAPMMGLNSVWFNEFFQNLYGMYAIHMGPCKEVAHIAIQYTFCNLWQETTPCSTLSTLQSSIGYLSGGAKKSLLVKSRLLAQDSLPKTTEFLPWWQQIKSIVKSLDINFVGSLSNLFCFISNHVQVSHPQFVEYMGGIGVQIAVLELATLKK